MLRRKKKHATYSTLIHSTKKLEKSRMIVIIVAVFFVNFQKAFDTAEYNEFLKK